MFQDFILLRFVEWKICFPEEDFVKNWNTFQETFHRNKNEIHVYLMPNLFHQALNSSTFSSTTYLWNESKAFSSKLFHALTRECRNRVKAKQRIKAFSFALLLRLLHYSFDLIQLLKSKTFIPTQFRSKYILLTSEVSIFSVMEIVVVVKLI